MGRSTAATSIAGLFGIVSPHAESLFNEVVSCIDRVHGITGRGRSTFRIAPIHGEGEYDSAMRSVCVSTLARYPHLTAIHEIGHVIEDAALRRRESLILQESELAAMGEPSPLRDWWGAVRVTPPYAEMRRTQALLTPDSEEHDTATYLLDPREIWARSYEQFIASSCHSVALQREFAEQMLECIALGGRSLYTYWRDEDFAPISAEIVRLFALRGWM
jgi:hypothetical protein